MKNIRDIFNENKFKKGSLATLILGLFLAILIIINLVVGKLDYSKDLTSSKIFTLSDQSYKILNNLKQNVTIYGFYPSNEEDPTVKTMLDQYAAHSSHIKILYRDPTKYPQLVQKFSTANTKIDMGYVVVESNSKFKVLDPNSFVNNDYSNPSNPTPQSLAIEQNVTSGILYVTSKQSTTVYTLEGQGEDALSSQVSNQLSLENYTVSPINLSLKSSVLKDNSVLLIVSPKTDLSQPEADDIRNYLSNGGKALFLMDLTENDLPNFQSVLNIYGVSMQKEITVEGNSSYVSQNPISLLPDQKIHAILNPLINSNLRVLIPGAQSIQILKNTNNSLTIEPLLTTSNNSWGKIDLKTNTLDKQSGDLTGPFNIAVAVTDKANNPKINDTKIVVVANSTFLSAQAISLSNNANLNFFMNSVNWVQGTKNNLSIRPKNIDDYTIQVSALGKLITSTFVLIIIPLIILVIGIIVWIKRRKL
jgi:ABC-type uncharacterized transport system involved in gliding motility auxiliary subunit